MAIDIRYNTLDGWLGWLDGISLLVCLFAFGFRNATHIHTHTHATNSSIHSSYLIKGKDIGIL
jgi:hypothetical protein